MTRDGALDVAEFTAAMHLVVLRRNNIPIPTNLPLCLQPQVLRKTLGLPQKDAEVDLLNLESDDNQQQLNNQHQMTQQRASVVASKNNEYQRMISSTYDDDYRTLSGGKSNTIINKSSTLPKNHFSSQHRGEGDGSASSLASNNSNHNNNNNNLNLNLHNNNNKQMNKNVITTASTTAASTLSRSGSNSPLTQQQQQTVVDGVNSDGLNANKEWTKFTESPTSNVSSPGPKPVNVTQAIVSDPSHVIHPVPLRVTPVASTELADEEALRTFRKADTLVLESGVMKAQASIIERSNEASPKQQYNNHKKQLAYGHHQRDSLPTDLRAIQRPHPKKPASKNIGQIPMPPPVFESNNNQVTVAGTSIVLSNKKEIPPLPPPRYFIYLNYIFSL